MASPKKGSEVSARMKEELKAKFPNTKFSVRYRSFAGGNDINIGWNWGATNKEVEAITGKYQYGHWNGMEDIYEYHKPVTVITASGEEEELGGVKFVFTGRGYILPGDDYKEEKTAQFYVAKDLAKHYNKEWVGERQTFLASGTTYYEHTAYAIARKLLDNNSFDTSEIKEYQGIKHIKDVDISNFGEGVTYNHDKYRFEYKGESLFSHDFELEFVILYDGKTSVNEALLKKISDYVGYREKEIAEKAAQEQKREIHNVKIGQLKTIINSPSISDAVKQLAQMTIYEIDSKELETDIQNVSFKRFALIEPIIIKAEFTGQDKYEKLEDFRQEIDRDKEKKKDVVHRAGVRQVLVVDSLNYTMLANCLLCNLSQVYLGYGGARINDDVAIKELGYTPEEYKDGFIERLQRYQLLPAEQMVWDKFSYTVVSLVFNEDTKESFVVNTENHPYARNCAFPVSFEEVEKVMLAIKVEPTIDKKPAKAVELNLMPREFFNSIDVTKLDDKTAALVNQIKNNSAFNHIDDEEISPEVKKIADYVYTHFPEALAIEPAVDTEKIARIAARKDHSVKQEVHSKAKMAIEAELTGLEERVGLIKEMIEANPKDKTIPDRLELVMDMLEEAKNKLSQLGEAPKLEDGGSLFLDSDPEAIEMIKGMLWDTLKETAAKIEYKGENTFDITIEEDATVDAITEHLNKINSPNIQIDDNKITQLFISGGTNKDEQGRAIITLKLDIEEEEGCGCPHDANTDEYAKGGTMSSHMEELYKTNNSINDAMQAYAGELGIFDLYYGHKVDAAKKAKWNRAYNYLNDKYKENGGGVDLTEEEAKELRELREYKESLRGQAVLDFGHGKDPKHARYTELVEKSVKSPSFGKELGIMADGGNIGDNDDDRDEGIAMIRYNDYWKKHRVFIDGSWYADFNNIDEAIEYVKAGNYILDKKSYSSKEDYNEGEHVVIKAGDDDKQIITIITKTRKDDSNGDTIYSTQDGGDYLYTQILGAIDDNFAKGGIVGSAKFNFRTNNSPLLEYANFKGGSHINLIRLVKPYKNGKSYAVSLNFGKETDGQKTTLFDTKEKAKAKFDILVKEAQVKNTLISNGVTDNYAKGGEIIISDGVKKLSDIGILSILRDHDHVRIFGDESREELEQILQLNLDDDLIDEIEVITVLSGETDEFAKGGTVSYQVYYMDNDGQKKIVEKDLTYNEAVKASQKHVSSGLSTDYEVQK